MEKWADYLISQVTYNAKHRIESAARHKDTGADIQEAEIVDRDEIILDLNNGQSYCTIFSGLDTWKLGDRIHLYNVINFRVVRIDDNRVNSDNLGPIPEVERPAEPELPEEPKPAVTQKEEPKPAVTQKEEPKPAVTQKEEEPKKDVQPQKPSAEEKTESAPAEKPKKRDTKSTKTATKRRTRAKTAK